MNAKHLTIIGFLFDSFFIFASGAADPTYYRSAEMQLKIINQTNHEIKLYLNKLDTSVSVRGNENYDSEILLMDFDNDYPLFVGIEYPDNSIKYYAFEHPGPEKRNNTNYWNYIFYVIVDNDRVYIFDENIYLENRNLENKDINKKISLFIGVILISLIITAKIIFFVWKYL
jgi:hypothetical protein